MNYAERLAEFVKTTGHKPGEMNKFIEGGIAAGMAPSRKAQRLAPGDSSPGPSAFSLEPPAQSTGPGRCNRFTRAAALGDPKPCVLDAGHEGAHEL